MVIFLVGEFVFAQEKSSGQEQVLAQLGQAAASAEQRCRHAETCAARLRGQAAEAEAGAAAALRFAGAEAERGKRLERELQSRLEDEQKKQRQDRRIQTHAIRISFLNIGTVLQPLPLQRVTELLAKGMGCGGAGEKRAEVRGSSEGVGCRAAAVRTAAEGGAFFGHPP